MTPELLVHANTGKNVGLGHLVRCMTLAKELLSRNLSVELRLKNDTDAVTFAQDGGLNPTISNPKRLKMDICSSPAELIIVDSYDFSSRDFELLADRKTLMVVDELGKRNIPADIVLNNNIYADKIEYPAADVVLRGTEYCMLREPFRSLPNPHYREKPESILVTVGGADLEDSFVNIVTVVASVATEVSINAVVGPYFEPPDNLPDQIEFHHDPPDIHELMLEADIAISGGGQTLYELAACGTPTIAVPLGTDQSLNIDGFEKAGFCHAVEKPDDSVFKHELRTHFDNLYRDSETRRKMMETGRSIVDGRGVFRVADRIEEQYNCALPDR